MKMTWRGIVEDMRNAAKFNRTPLNSLPDGFRASGTICGEAVVTRESVAKRLEIWADFIEYECKKLEHLLIAEQEENIDLRRALKPVMKCEVLDCDYEIYGDPGFHDTNLRSLCHNAVREAQAIMKEGEKC